MTAVLFSPHNDDSELFACHVLLREAPLVVVCLRSYVQEAQGVGHEEREAETARAMDALGCDWTQWEHPDSDPNWGLLDAAMCRLCMLVEPTVVYAPAYDFAANGHSPGSPPERFGVLHHDYVGWIAHGVFGDAVRFYQTYTRWGGPVEEGVRVELTDGEQAAKRAALACYESQIRLDSTGHHFQRPPSPEWLKPRCMNCLDTGTACENHPDRPWAGLADVEECCGGAGIPCPSCCSPIPADGSTSISVAFTPDAL